MKWNLIQTSIYKYLYESEILPYVCVDNVLPFRDNCEASLNIHAFQI